MSWNIFAATPLLVSQAQLEEFMALFPDGDARKLQPLDGPTEYLVAEPSAWVITTLGLVAARTLRRRRPHLGEAVHHRRVPWFELAAISPRSPT